MTTRPRPGGGRIARGLRRELLYLPFQLPRRARAEGVSVLHCPAPLAPVRPGLPLVVTVHDVMAVERPEWFTGANALQQRLVMPRVLRRAAAVTTPSEYTSRRLLELLPLEPDAVSVVPWGVGEQFTPGPSQNAAGEPYLLAVGALQPRKNVETTAAAFERLADRGTEHRLVVAGPRGWRDEDVVRRLESSRHVDRIEVRGEVTDAELVDLYRGAECLVAASRYEGFGFTVLEAMACGTPVVASDATSHPEVVGDAGVLFDPDDPGDLVGALTTVLDSESLRAQLTERGLARAREFTWSRCAERTVAAYKIALERGGAA